MHIQFDGGSLGTGDTNPGAGALGYFIVDSTGHEIIRVGMFLGKNKTNNECEAAGLQQSLEHVH